MSTWTDVLGAMFFFSDNDLVDKFEEIKRNAPTGSEGGLTLSLNIEGNYGTLMTDRPKFSIGGNLYIPIGAFVSP